jgi:hypothetical protein
MESATATPEERKQIKDACLNILSTFEDTMMSTVEVTELVKQEYPHLAIVIDKYNAGSAHLVGAILFQIAANKNGTYKYIQNPSRGHYVYSKQVLPVRSGIKTYQSHTTTKRIRDRRIKPAGAKFPEAVPQVTVKETPAPSIIDKAPHFAFVGKINGQIIVKDDKDNLYVVQPAQLA